MNEQHGNCLGIPVAHELGAISMSAVKPWTGGHAGSAGRALGRLRRPARSSRAHSIIDLSGATQSSWHSGLHAPDVPGTKFRRYSTNEELIAKEICHYPGHRSGPGGQTSSRINEARSGHRRDGSLPAVGHRRRHRTREIIGPTRASNDGDVEARACGVGLCRKGRGVHIGDKNTSIWNRRQALAFPGAGGKLTVHSSDPEPDRIQMGATRTGLGCTR